MFNDTRNPQVFLVGFLGVSVDYNPLISFMMFFVYMISLTANGSVVCLVILNLHLHKPMYLIIANLAASNLLFDTVTLPKLITKYWFGASYMSFSSCILQMFCVRYLGSLDAYLLTVMAIDRYISIYQPLRYAMIMTMKTTFIVCGICWVFLATSTNTVISVQAAEIVLCGNNKIQTLFCTHASITSLACTDVTHTRNVAFVSAMIVLFVTFGVILVSYILIIAVISSRSESWQKAFYTCTTHLLVVGLYYIPRIFVYMVNNISSVTIPPKMSVLLLFLYSVVPHVANPVIYFLRTKAIRQTVSKMAKKIKCRLNHAVCF